MKKIMSLWSQPFWWVLLLSNFFVLCNSFKPIFMVHGIMSKNHSMEALSKRIQEMHPGTKTHISDRFLRWSSLEPLWRQVIKLGEDFKVLNDAYPDGFHLIGYSQGGVIARGLLELFPDHNVRTFISLSSPQAGQFGDSFLHLIFPSLVCSSAYELFYSRMGQRISVGNYWNDPHHQTLYYKFNNYLPFINNEIQSNLSDSFKKGILNLKKFILIGGPDDGIITPWQSSHFGYYGEDGAIVGAKNRSIYLNDSIGLRTLDSQNKLQLIEIRNVSHFSWHKNHTVIDNYILPWLD